MRIHCFQHVPYEPPGTIAEWALINNHAVTYTYFFEEIFSLPALTDFDLLLIMGGFMNVDEENLFPWLSAEKIFIKNAIDADKKIIGICLGAQLVAASLGYKVYKGKEKEIGFFPITFSNEALRNPLFNHFSQPYTLFHWHGDSFNLPEEAVVLASTTVCKHQAYLIHSKILGLQFHLEMNEQTLEQMLLHDGNELEEKGTYIQSAVEIRSGYTYLEQNRKDIFVLLDKFLHSSPDPFSAAQRRGGGNPPLSTK